MKHKTAKTVGASVLTLGLALSGAGAAEAASRTIYGGLWQYGVSSTVNWTSWTYKSGFGLRNLVLQNGASVRYMLAPRNTVHMEFQRPRHATENYQGINW